MTADMMTFWGLETPCYVLEESLLRRNLRLIRQVADEAGVEIILAWQRLPARCLRRGWRLRSLAVRLTLIHQRILSASLMRLWVARRT